jgi:P22 coat protein - gene protein 5
MKKIMMSVVALCAMALSTAATAAVNLAKATAWNYCARTGLVLGPNVLSNLAADMYRAADIVGREQVGILPSITINAGSQAAALGDIVRSHFTRTPVAKGITPSMQIPEGDDQTVDNKFLTIDTPVSVQIPWTGEDMKHVNNGTGFETIYGDQIAQALRVMTNQIEVDIWLAAYRNASRAFGVAGTTPFGSNFNEVAELRQILVDNGCPMDGQNTLALSTTAGTKLRNLANLQSVAASGSDSLLRQGELLNLQGLRLKESAGIGIVAKGTASGYSTNTSGYAVGATAITLTAGTGTAAAGEVITFAGDNNQYVLATAFTGGVVTIAEPGLRQAIAPAATAVTLGNAFTGNVAFHKGAIEIAMRPMADPEGGDAAVDKMIIQDPWSGLSFEVAAYKGFKKAMFMVSAVYGIKAWKRQNITILKG